MSRPKKARAAPSPALDAVLPELEVAADEIALTLVEDLIRTMSESFVTRAEYDRLAAQVEELRARVPTPPAPQVTAEEVAIIAAAVTAYLGKPVRVRGARLVSAAPGNRPSPWQQQGRVTIQASHDLGSRRSG
jgi:hypothetical protein